MRIKLAQTNKDFIQNNDPLTNISHHNFRTNKSNYCNQIVKRLSAWNLLSGLENPSTTSSTANRSKRWKACSNLNSLIASRSQILNFAGRVPTAAHSLMILFVNIYPAE